MTHDRSQTRHAPAVPTAVTWATAQSGSWNTAADWSSDAIPTASDSVTIAATGTYTLSVTAPAAAQALSLASSGATLALTSSLAIATEFAITDFSLLGVGKGGSIEAGTLVIENGGALQLEAGIALNLSGTVSLGAGTDNYSAGGIISGPGRLTTSGTTTINGDVNDYYDGELILGNGITWVNDGLVNDDGQIEIATAPGAIVHVVNAAGATFNIDPGWNTSGVVIPPGFYISGSGSAVLTNAGTLALHSGGLYDYNSGEIDADVINTGLLEVVSGQNLVLGGDLSNSGTIDLIAGGTLTLQAGGSLRGTIEGTGTLLLGAGTFWSGTNFSDSGTLAVTGAGEVLHVTGTQSATVGLLLEGPGEIVLSKGAHFIVSGTCEFDAGVLSPSQIGSVLGAGTLVTTGTTSVTDSKGDYVEAAFGAGVTWLNSGVVYDEGPIALGTSLGASASIVNAPNGIFYLTIGQLADGGIYTSSPSRVSFTNDGTIVADSSFVSYEIASPLANAGDFIIDGTSPGVTTNGSIVLEAGLTNLAKGTIYILDGGALGVNGGGSIAGTVSAVDAGLYFGAGTYTVQTRVFDASILQNSGTIQDSATINLDNSDRGDGVFLNEAGAVFDLTGAARILTSGTVTFTNDGLIEKTGASSLSVISDAITNDRTISAVAGTLALTRTVFGSGSLLIGAGATLSVAGRIGGGQKIHFIGEGGILKLGNPGAETALAGFGVGDFLDLTKIVATNAEISGNELIVTAASAEYIFVSNALTGDAVSYGPYGTGGTSLTITQPIGMGMDSHHMQ